MFFSSFLISFKNFLCIFNWDLVCLVVTFVAFVGSVATSGVGCVATSCVGILSHFYWK